jgi:diguanylate cyclase (GGDEF)-like protein
MLDIDKFKRVNDEHGHDAGDVVLIELGSVIRRVVRQEDIVARYGGEEFCILVPETPMADAAGMAERLRRAIASEVLPAEAGTRQVTVSVGMAAMVPSDREQEVFTRADAAMYAVKRQGGNHTCIALEDGGFRRLDRLGDTGDPP